MKKINITTENGKLQLSKSNKFIGIISKTKKNKTPKKLEDRKMTHARIGAFKVFQLPRGMRKLEATLDELRAEKDIQVGSHIYHIAGDSDRVIVPSGYIYIYFNEEASETEQEKLIKKLKLELIKRRTAKSLLVKVTKKSVNPLKSANLLMESELVQLAQADLAEEPTYYDFSMPNNGLLDLQWYIRNIGTPRQTESPSLLVSGSDCKIAEAWIELGNKGSDDVKLAIVDTGFDIDHPDLTKNDRTVFSIYTTDGNLDQFNFTKDHGTSCASLAVADGSPNGIIGVSPNAKFYAIDGAAKSSFLVEKLFDYCIEQEIDIVSCSWGSVLEGDQLDIAKREAINKAATQGRNGKGCVILYAAGNESREYINFYAQHPDVIAVGGSTSADEHFWHSNRGGGLSVVAPAGIAPIIAARASWDQGSDHAEGNFKYWYDGIPRGEPTRYKHFEGTSAATPIVAGVCALMLSANPNLTASEVKEILEQTADKIGNPYEYNENGYSRRYGHGRVNALRAVRAAKARAVGTGLPQQEDDLFIFSAQPQSTEGFAIQVGTYRKYGNVLKATDKLQKQFNRRVVVNIIEPNNRLLYRVMLGVFFDKATANNFKNQIQDKFPGAFVKNLADL